MLYILLFTKLFRMKNGLLKLFGINLCFAYTLLAITIGLCSIFLGGDLLRTASLVKAFLFVLIIVSINIIPYINMTVDKARIRYSKWQLEKQEGLLWYIAKRAVVGLSLIVLVFISQTVLPNSFLWLVITLYIVGLLLIYLAWCVNINVEKRIEQMLNES